MIGYSMNKHQSELMELRQKISASEREQDHDALSKLLKEFEAVSKKGK